MVANKDIEKLIGRIRTWPGWRVDDGTKAYRVYPPDKAIGPIMIHRTPSGSRYLANKTADLKRAGAPQ